MSVPRKHPAKAEAPSVAAVPAEGLAGDLGDQVEAAVVVEEGQAVQFGGGGDDRVYRAGAAMLTQGGELTLDLPGAGIGAVVDREPGVAGRRSIPVTEWQSVR
jgi:hypothetical protein